MKKYLLLVLITMSLQGCKLVTENPESLTQEEFASQNMSVYNSSSSYQEFLGRGIQYAIYAYVGNQKYYIWIDPKIDQNRNNTVIAHTLGGGPQRFKFVRPAMDIILSPKAGDQKFIIDFGKDYNGETAYGTGLARYLYVEKSGSTFRGRMINYIQWDNLSTDFTFQTISSLPTSHIVPSNWYNDVQTIGAQYHAEEPLGFGFLPAFDALRNNQIVKFNYLTQNGVKYWMWLDLRIGVDNEMSIYYHKPGVKGTIFKAEKRPVVDIFYNPSYSIEFILDLGKEVSGIPRYVYIKKTGANSFRGNILSSMNWQGDTPFSITTASLPKNYQVTSEYNDVDTVGEFEGFSSETAGTNPVDYTSAWNEIAYRMNGVVGLQKSRVQYQHNVENTLIQTHTKELWYSKDEDDEFNKIKFTHIIRYDGRDNKGTVYNNYYGIRTYVNADEVYAPDVESFLFKVGYKGSVHSKRLLTDRDYYVYHSKSDIGSITNTRVGGHNIWNSYQQNPDKPHQAFLIKELSHNKLVILEVFKAYSHESRHSYFYDIIDPNFDLDNPSEEYIYTITP